LDAYSKSKRAIVFNALKSKMGLIRALAKAVATRICCPLADGILANASIALVFVYIFITSGFLALVGMSEIILRIPLAWCLLRVILQVKYFAALNIIVTSLSAPSGKRHLCLRC
jgi:hypothetical protein